MDLLNEINNCTSEELEQIIDEALQKITRQSDPKEVLGFSQNSSSLEAHKGFIHPNTKIKYSNWTMNTYSMQTKDYFYEFAKYLKQNNIKDKGSLVKYLQNFINAYFGIIKIDKDLREDYFNQLAWQTTTTDEEYFAKLENLEIGNLKGQNIAMCTERAAVAQNLLALFDFETYYCIGCINNDGREEPHAFNIAKASNCYILLDYSVPSCVIANGKIVDYAPFQGKIKESEIEDFLTGEKTKEFNLYIWLSTQEEPKQIPNGKKRQYIVGSFELERKNNHHI